MTLKNILAIVVLLSLLGMGSLTAQEISPTPGTYELLEGKSMQFDARQKMESIKPTRHEWRIVSGKGAELLNAKTPRVTFVAPSRLNEASRSFTLQLDTRYPKGQKPSQAQINIRVHRKTEKVVKRERSPWLTGTVGFGFGYLWGGWWPYPPVIIFPPPPPGEVWPPEEIPPIAVPLPEDPSFEDWAADNPEIAQPILEADPLVPESLRVEQPSYEIESSEVGLPIEPAPEAIIEPAPMPDQELAPVPMDMPEPMDMPAMDMDMPMDMGGFD